MTKTIVHLPCQGWMVDHCQMQRQSRRMRTAMVELRRSRGPLGDAGGGVSFPSSGATVKQFSLRRYGCCISFCFVLTLSQPLVLYILHTYRCTYLALKHLYVICRQSFFVQSVDAVFGCCYLFLYSCLALVGLGGKKSLIFAAPLGQLASQFILSLSLLIII